MAEKMTEMIRNILTFTVVMISGFLWGMIYADKHHPVSSHQAVHRMENQGRHAICPENHLCEWKAWDLNDDQEVPKEYYLPEVK